MACCCFAYPPPLNYSAAENVTHRGGPIKATGVGETDKNGATNCRNDTEKRNLKRKEETITESHSTCLTEEHTVAFFNPGRASSYSSDSVSPTENQPSGRKRIRLDSAGEVSSSNDVVPAKFGRTIGAKFRSNSKPYDALASGWKFAAIQAEQSETEEDLDWLLNSRKPERRVEADWEDGDCSVSTSASSCSMWQKAQWLSDAQVYALPYTVPL